MTAIARARESKFRSAARFWLGTARGLSKTAGAVLDLAVRLLLAKSFFASGLLKAMNWDSALHLATNEYPVSWLSPASAAYLGASIELIAPAFLAIGLFTRVAALPLLILSLVIQFSYRALDTNLFWAALLGWFVVFGPGPLSFDRLFGHGLKNSALPFAARIIHLAQSLRLRGGPPYQLALRLWLAAALVGLDVPERFFPVMTAHALPRMLAFGCGTLIAVGLAAPLASAFLVTAALGVQMMGAGDGLTLYGLAVFAFAGTIGAGTLSLDRAIFIIVDRWLVPARGVSRIEGWPQVAIVGGGFGGIACALKLRFLPVRITLIDRRNYHLFQPLLYQIATASLSPGDIAIPIRSVFRDDPNVRVLNGTVTGIDTAGKAVIVGAKSIPYDYLVLATGASHSYFGKDQWAEFAPGLKRLEDATDIRGRILRAFERAEATEDASERDRLLTFLIVGGGATGVELAGAIAELARHGLEKDFRGFDPASARVVLVQSGARILPAFPEDLSSIAKSALEALGVEVSLNSRVEAIDDNGVTVSGARLAAATVIWAAGVVAAPTAKWLGVDPDSAGRVKVAADLSVPGLANVFAIGDTAAVMNADGSLVPGLAPAAKQGGEYVAAVIRARLLDRAAPAVFRYRHQGSLATIGRKSAVADFGWIRLSGAAAWWLWGAVHVVFLVGLRNRLSVTFNWVWAYVTYGGGARLITGDDMDGEPIGGAVPLDRARRA